MLTLDQFGSRADTGLFVALFLACAFVACGPSESESAKEPDKKRSSRSPARTISLPPRPVDTEALGALHGEIRYTGDAPDRFELGAGKKSECKAHADVQHLSDVIVASNGRVAGVLVRVTRGFDDSDVPAAPETAVVLDQRGCIYTPHVLGLRVGQTLEIRNSDPTTHNVNAKPRKNDGPGNRNMGQGQAAMRVDFERPELSIVFKCDIHPWMGAQVHVIEHPWFAVTRGDGTFTIANVPPGKYTVEALHETLGRLSARDLVVEAGQSTGFALTFEF